MFVNIDEMCTINVKNVRNASQNILVILDSED